MNLETKIHNGEIYFEGIQLDSSFILGWNYIQGNSELVFEVEFAIFPGNPFYEKPEKDNYTYYRIGQLIFKGVTEISGFKEKELIKPYIDIDYSKDWGEIDRLMLNNENIYKIENELIEFGIDCKELILQFN
jgi:hypothetical protein